MDSISVIDRLHHKPVQITTSVACTYGQKIIYESEWKQQLWIVLWYDTPASKKWSYIRHLEWDELKKHIKNEKKAKEYYTSFKKQFKKTFPQASPVNARFNLQWNTIYYYFFSEDRFDFSWFVKEYRKVIRERFFLYQVWARDSVRLSPAAAYREWCCGTGKLCCTTNKYPVPSVETETIILQNLESRWVENLKWHCWKLKCSLNFEKWTYEEDLKKYPLKWKLFTYNGSEYMCISNNIFTGETVAQNPSWWSYKTLLLNKPLVSSPCCHNTE